MKKIFTLVVALAATLSLSAQSISFADAEGNEIKDGSTLVMNELETVDYGGGWVEYQVPLKGLYISNTTEDETDVKLKLTAVSLPSGNFQCCFPQNCQILSKTQPLVTASSTIEPGDILEIKNTEWGEVKDGAYGTAIVTFQLIDALSEDVYTTLTINFVYADPAGINAVEANADANSNVYNVAGQQMKSAQKGINIVNGKKYIVK